MYGNFSPDAIEAFTKAVGEENFSETLFDFTTCIRPDGSAYGTGGTCRKGTPGEARKEARAEIVKQKHEVLRLRHAREAAAGAEDKKAAAEARRAWRHRRFPHAGPRRARDRAWLIAREYARWWR
jgi:hypothetical protein